MSVSKEAAVAVSKGFSSDQKRLSSDLVGFESHKRGDPKYGSPWASIVDASSHEDEAAGNSIRFDTAVADTAFPGVEDAMDNTESQSTVAGKAWSANVVGSGVRKMGSTRAWVKKGPTTGPDLGKSKVDSVYKSEK